MVEAICMIVAYPVITLFNIIYIILKEEKAFKKFKKKLNDKGYKKIKSRSAFNTLDEKLIFEKNYIRMILSAFPILNFYPFIEIISKKIDREYVTMINSLDKEEILDYLEGEKYIYNQNTVAKREKNLVEKIDEISKDTNGLVEFSKKDSLEMLRQKRVLLNEMIYLKNLEEMSKEDSSQKEVGKQLKIVKKTN